MSAPVPPQLVRLLNASDRGQREAAWADFVNAHTKLLLHASQTVSYEYDETMDRYAFLLEQLQKDDFHRLRKFAAEGPSTFTTWLFAVARRLLVDYHRAKYGRDRGSGGDSDQESADRIARRNIADLVAEQLTPDFAADRSNPSPEQAILADELRDALIRALNGLEERDRLLLRLRLEDDVPVKQIASMMSFPSQFHVYRRLKTLYQDLREQLNSRGIESPEV